MRNLPFSKFEGDTSLKSLRSRIFPTLRSLDETQTKIDRLGITSTALGLYYFINWLLQFENALNQFVQYGNISFLLCLSFIGLTIFQIARPCIFSLTALNSVIFILLIYLPQMPNGSNNQTMGVFLAAIALLTLLTSNVAKDAVTRRENAFKYMAQPGRWLLAILYFFGIFHKINTDFLDPNVSCAVELYHRLTYHIGLSDWIIGQYGSIYATFIIEAVAMILLFSKRYKLIGFAVGIPFHIIIGFTGYAFYMDFSAIVLTTYTLFLPREFALGLQNDIEKIRRRFSLSDSQIQRILKWCIVLFLVTLIAVASASELYDPDFRRRPYPVMPFFGVVAIGFYVLCLRYIPWSGGTGHIPAFALRNSWTALLPIAFFINGWSPYVGLKTESSIAMFSNLHTEGGQINHLFFTSPVYLADYQRDLVKIQRIVGPYGSLKHLESSGIFLTRYEFDRIRSQYPHVPMEFEYQGRDLTTDDPWDNLYDATPILLKKYLLFKPVDFNRPKVCTH